MQDGSHPQGTNPPKQDVEDQRFSSARVGGEKEHPPLPSVRNGPAGCEGMRSCTLLPRPPHRHHDKDTWNRPRRSQHLVLHRRETHPRTCKTVSQTNRTGGHGTCMVGCGGERSIHSSIHPSDRGCNGRWMDQPRTMRGSFSPTLVRRVGNATSLRVSWVPLLATGDDGSDGHDVVHVRSCLHDAGYDATFVHVVRCMRRDPSTDGTNVEGAGCDRWSRSVFSSHVPLDPFFLSFSFTFSTRRELGWSWTRMGKTFVFPSGSDLHPSSGNGMEWNGMEWKPRSTCPIQVVLLPPRHGMDRLPLFPNLSISLSVGGGHTVEHSFRVSYAWDGSFWGGVDGEVCLCDTRSETKGQGSPVPGTGRGSDRRREETQRTHHEEDRPYGWYRHLYPVHECECECECECDHTITKERWHGSIASRAREETYAWVDASMRIQATPRVDGSNHV